MSDLDAALRNAENAPLVPQEQPEPKKKRIVYKGQRHLSTRYGLVRVGDSFEENDKRRDYFLSLKQPNGAPYFEVEEV